ncbi:PREDICTED: calcium-binding protein 7 [Charadrius vociferus]|uniref:calcium-binding protein 7 n=1 Tax=Charadrius vociferus TaxID=50402 RepID=UPI000521BDBF|nr:PREDICTED: calcium-binding protein 7 [Charadrius vociferus]
MTLRARSGTGTLESRCHRLLPPGHGVTCCGDTGHHHGPAGTLPAVELGVTVLGTAWPEHPGTGYRWVLASRHWVPPAPGIVAADPTRPRHHCAGPSRRNTSQHPGEMEPMSLPEVAVPLRHNRSLVSPEIREAFKVFDRDGNGFISKQELGTAMRSLGYMPNEVELEVIIQRLDMDGDGQVDFEEFVTLLGPKLSTSGIPEKFHGTDFDTVFWKTGSAVDRDRERAAQGAPRVAAVRGAGSCSGKRGLSAPDESRQPLRAGLDPHGVQIPVPAARRQPPDRLNPREAARREIT